MSVLETESDSFMFQLSAEDALRHAESKEARFHIRQAMQHEIAAGGDGRGY